MAGRVRAALSAASWLFLLLPLALVDRWLAQGSRPRLGYLQLLEERLAKKPDAAIAMMGQSTIGKWLVDGDRFARMYQLAPSAVVGAQIGGCDYTCSFAEARHLLAAGKHFKQIYFGANLYQMCEDPTSWRVFTPLALIPWRDLPDLLALWGHAKQPLSYYGRSLGMAFSQAYDDSIAARERVVTALGLPYSKRHGIAIRWALPRPATRDKGWSPACGYEPQQIALKTEAVRLMLPDLTRLADRVYYMALPDRSLGDPAYRDAFRSFIAHQRALANAVPRVTFVDLVSEGASLPGDYADGAHLSATGKEKQTLLLRRKLDELNTTIP
jgi:hypothetical protein